ncbi:hypothetical protein MNBD_ALPHA12-192 [hydrothermal vent metagenome]|uniref:Uncharacterized protein n=1 Tax=hydrothermal vent metagenome TaxID=652676 RepID=A0A3B0U038_9ZZZZ
MRLAARQAVNAFFLSSFRRRPQSILVHVMLYTKKMDPGLRRGDAQYFLLNSFPILCMDTFLGGGAGEGPKRADGGANKERVPGTGAKRPTAARIKERVPGTGAKRPTAARIKERVPGTGAQRPTAARIKEQVPGKRMQPATAARIKSERSDQLRRVKKSECRGRGSGHPPLKPKLYPKLLC